MYVSVKKGLKQRFGSAIRKRVDKPCFAFHTLTCNEDKVIITFFCFEMKEDRSEEEDKTVLVAIP